MNRLSRGLLLASLVLTQGCHLTFATFDYGGDGGRDAGPPPVDSGDVDAEVDAGDLDAGDRDSGGRDGGCVGECTPSAVDTSPNQCGNPAPRTCSDTCEWGPYVLAESAATCDYCDDDPDGVREADAGFASVTRTHQLTSMVNLQGDAFGTCFGTNCFIDLVPNDGLGGTFVPSAEPLGYGGGTVTLDVRATAGGSSPGLGWAFVAYVDPAPDPLLGSPSDLGVNLAADGFSVEWSTMGTDVVRLRRLDSTGADPVIEGTNVGDQLVGPSGSRADQQLDVTWAPDNPATPADETTVTVVYPCAVTPTCAPIGCGGTTGVPCGFTLRPGDLVTYGVVAAGTAAFPGAYRLNNSAIALSRLCP